MGQIIWKIKAWTRAKIFCAIKIRTKLDVRSQIKL